MRDARRRQAGRDPRAHPREGRRDRDGEDVRQARALRGRDVDRPGVHARASSGSSRAATSSRAADASSATTARRASSTGAARVLTVDLTNRCNMMCDPCFMDANQVGFVHELEWDEVKKILDDSLDDPAAPADERAVLRRRADALAALPRARSRTRETSGTSACSARPTASGSRRTRRSPTQAKEAGLRLAYLQFDGVGERGERAPQGRQPVRREAARDREPARGGHRRRARRDGRARRQRRPGRADRRVRDRERRQGHRRLVPAGQLHRPRRGHLDDERARAALHAVAPRARRQRRRPARPSRCATGSRSRRWARSATSPT